MSVLVIDSPWDTAFNDFEFNPKQFPNAQEMIDYIHGMGNKLVLWITPFTNVRSWVEVEGQKDRASNFDYADRNGYFAKDSEGNTMIVTWWKGDGGMIDFTNEDAKEWWQDQHKKLIEMGVDGFKTDDGEYVPYAAHFSNGKSGREMHNLYSLLYNEAIYEALNSSIDEHILFARSGFAGSQKYPAVWAGDQEGSFNYRDGLPAVIIAGQNMGMSGFSIWSHDIGGYRTPPDKNCFIRWAQFGCFSPIMQIHGQNREPWKFDDETVEIYRKYAKMHNSLFPYSYTYAKIANETGLPIMRPLVLLYPEDQNTYNQDFEYFFGNEFLVAPIYQNTTQRAVYLPDGEWIDYWNGTAYQGKQEVRYHAPLDKMPLFVKSGAIIPMISEKVDTLVPKSMVKDPTVVSFDDMKSLLILDVYPKGKSEFVMYDDTSFKCKEKSSGLDFKISRAPCERTYLLKVRLSDKPNTVKTGWRTLPEVDSVERFLATNEGWVWDELSSGVLIKITLKESGKLKLK